MALKTYYNSYNTSNNKNDSISMTPRFTQFEKNILYTLFRKHQGVIDIKFRKKQRGSYIRDTWNELVNEFNSSAGINTPRNLKQIQKFWLNIRVRKQYSYVSSKSTNGINSIEFNDRSNGNDEQEFLCNVSGKVDHHNTIESSNEMDIAESIHESSIDEEEPHKQAQQSGELSIDEIRTEKLTFNDLLQFKTSRPQEEIILQIKHPSEATGNQLTLPPPTHINIQTQHLTQQLQPQHQQQTLATITANGYNQQIIGEIKPQQITLAQYNQAQQQQNQLFQQQFAVATPAAAATSQQQSTQVISAEQFGTSTANITFDAKPGTPTSVLATTQILQPTLISTTTSTNNTTVIKWDEQINYLDLKEAELRYKEQLVALEAKKIALNHAQEDMNHMRELHRMQVEAMRIKIDILKEEEKQLSNKNVS